LPAVESRGTTSIGRIVRGYILEGRVIGVCWGDEKSTRLIGSQDGINWGFLWSYRHQEDIFVSLAFSRDGRNFQRSADRPRLISPGDEGSWDGGMVSASGWIEVG
jgi:hypothetical protein